jgi:hypothetical protein
MHANVKLNFIAPVGRDDWPDEAGSEETKSLFIYFD